MVIEKMKGIFDNMFPAEKKVARYIMDHSDKVVDMNIGDIADKSETSEATVIRTCRRLGFRGFYQLKIGLAKDSAQKQLIEYHGEQDDPNTVTHLLRDTAKHILDLSDQVETDAILVCAKLIRECKTTHIIARGNTIPVAQDFAFRLGRIGIKSDFSFVPEYCYGNVNLGDARDIAVGISHSGTSISVIQALELAGKRGMKTIAITDCPRSMITKHASVSIYTPISSDIYNGFGAVSNVYMLALTEVLIYFIANLNQTTKDADELELMLGEFKL